MRKCGTQENMAEKQDKNRPKRPKEDPDNGWIQTKAEAAVTMSRKGREGTVLMEILPVELND